MLAQQLFIPNGKITFEKKINMVRALSELGLSDDVKASMTKYKSNNWDLYFDRSRSIYKAQKKDDNDDDLMYFMSPGESTNQLYADYTNKTRVLKKNLMGDDYLLKDTIPKINWKIMHDIRIISGYECRKAIGRINDTVYVVAFYTDEILLRGGPEGFSGLPGMILGLAIPRLNTTWFATKVEAFTNFNNEIQPPTKGKRAETDRELKKLIELFTRYNGNKNEKPEEILKTIYGFVL
ncbi:GLPGLI family protein [Pedobacter ginsengisoli]|uniref:GLPGLI family protein n=1 Tax=Pedobacter ginsengisoli TaxID=363852 RepID=UPI001FEAFD58|nr:GLPGLI family protein [Pedobacter ginsengisoli]